MEPVLGGRDDLGIMAKVLDAITAAMEPVLGGRDDSIQAGQGNWTLAPQWSPSLADGTTRSRRRDRAARHPAAMEPVLGGRDDLAAKLRQPLCHSRRNGARPWRTGRRHLPGWRHARNHCRNGARPWRTGRPEAKAAVAQYGEAAMEPVLGGRDDDPALVAVPVTVEPQWSPSLADGTTGQAAARYEVQADAAMEPVLGGRDDQRTRGSAGAARRGRNGARPWRTGRRAVARLLRRQHQEAAMEPVLGGRDDLLSQSLHDADSNEPQWSPSLADGTTFFA